MSVQPIEMTTAGPGRMPRSKLATPPPGVASVRGLPNVIFPQGGGAEVSLSLSLPEDIVAPRRAAASQRAAALAASVLAALHQSHEYAEFAAAQGRLAELQGEQIRLAAEAKALRGHLDTGPALADLPEADLSTIEGRHATVARAAAAAQAARDSAAERVKQAAVNVAGEVCRIALEQCDAALASFGDPAGLTGDRLAALVESEVLRGLLPRKFWPRTVGENVAKELCGPLPAQPGLLLDERKPPAQPFGGVEYHPQGSPGYGQGRRTN